MRRCGQEVVAPESQDSSPHGESASDGRRRFGCRGGTAWRSATIGRTPVDYESSFEVRPIARRRARMSGRPLGSSGRAETRGRIHGGAALRADGLSSEERRIRRASAAPPTAVISPRTTKRGRERSRRGGGSGPTGRSITRPAQVRARLSKRRVRRVRHPPACGHGPRNVVDACGVQGFPAATSVPRQSRLATSWCGRGADAWDGSLGRPPRPRSPARSSSRPTRPAGLPRPPRPRPIHPHDRPSSSWPRVVLVGKPGRSAVRALGPGDALRLHCPRELAPVPGPQGETRRRSGS